VYKFKVQVQVSSLKFVAGVVNVEPDSSRDFMYAFYEIDTTDTKIHEFVLSIYTKHNIDVVSHHCGKGWHYFGAKIDRMLWREWYAELKHLNVKYPPLTLRITKKFQGEVWERPIYHEAQLVTPNWSKALMFFLNKEQSDDNPVNLWKAMRRCGLEKYFKCVVYPIIPKPEITASQGAIS
jgi:hypothetical protein